MIRVRLEQHNDGRFSAIATEGHANEAVCLATSAAIHGFCAQIEQLAALYPKQIVIERILTGGD